MPALVDELLHSQNEGRISGLKLGSADGRWLSVTVNGAFMSSGRQISSVLLKFTCHLLTLWNVQDRMSVAWC